MTHTTTTTREAFHTHLREVERLRNAGSTTRYHEATNTTAWMVAGQVVGLSTGRVGNGTAYRIVTEQA
jgi:hypothetical protein